MQNSSASAWGSCPSEEAPDFPSSCHVARGGLPAENGGRSGDGASLPSQDEASKTPGGAFIVKGRAASPSSSPPKISTSHEQGGFNNRFAPQTRPFPSSSAVAAQCSPSRRSPQTAEELQLRSRLAEAHCQQTRLQVDVEMARVQLEEARSTNGGRSHKKAPFSGGLWG